jgi:predicted SAM-dependent methyltransferase
LIRTNEMTCYKSETEKIRAIAANHLITPVVDIGCGHDKITTTAFGIDSRGLPGVDLVVGNDDIYRLSDLVEGRLFGTVYSSHCLEHLERDRDALFGWSRLLVPGGLIFLYLPDDRGYDNASNPEHKQRYVYQTFTDRFSLGRDLDFLEVVNGDEDHRDGCYSFWVVLKRRS